MKLNLPGWHRQAPFDVRKDHVIHVYHDEEGTHRIVYAPDEPTDKAN